MLYTLLLLLDTEINTTSNQFLESLSLTDDLYY